LIFKIVIKKVLKCKLASLTTVMVGISLSRPLPGGLVARDSGRRMESRTNDFDAIFSTESLSSLT
jgi:hypothetical protein